MAITTKVPMDLKIPLAIVLDEIISKGIYVIKIEKDSKEAIDTVLKRY
ncbi:hypothetical protein [Flavobacterium sp.]|jgi:hypothetical protein|nr:hypothetical protein [Flavobacterium sp.]